MKPKEILSKYNKLGGAKIPINKGNCRKLSQLKYILNSKKTEDIPIVANLIELESWLKSKFYFQAEDGSFESISSDSVFVANYKIEKKKLLL